MSDLVIGIIIGVFLMSCLATVGALLLDSCNDLGFIFVGPGMWLFFAGYFIFYLIQNLFKAQTVSLYNFEELKKTNMFYKHLFGNFYLIRFYGNKQMHPILYHLLIIRKIKVRKPAPRMS